MTEFDAQSWIKVTPWNVDDVIQRLKDRLIGRWIDLIATDQLDADSNVAIPMSRRQVVIGSIETGAGGDGQRWIGIMDPAGKAIVAFLFPTHTSGPTAPFLSVNISDSGRMVQFMQPTMHGFGLWLFVA